MKQTTGFLECPEAVNGAKMFKEIADRLVVEWKVPKNQVLNAMAAVLIDCSVETYGQDETAALFRRFADEIENTTPNR